MQHGPDQAGVRADGWHTAGLDHITFRVADAKKEAAFYAALMGWKLRSDDGKRVVMDIGDWGTAVFRQAPADSFPARSAGWRRADAVPVRAVVEGFGFAIEPWNAKTVEAELSKRGLNPVADNDGKGFESFHVKDPDGFDLQISNGKRLRQGARDIAGERDVRRRRRRSSRPAGRPCGSTTSRSAPRTTRRACRSTSNLLGWRPTYDEGSQNELMIGDVGDIIIRGGNPLDPTSARATRAPAGASITSRSASRRGTRTA